jgi:hypothetical protein
MKPTDNLKQITLNFHKTAVPLMETCNSCVVPPPLYPSALTRVNVTLLKGPRCVCNLQLINVACNELGVIPLRGTQLFKITFHIQKHKKKKGYVTQLLTLNRHLYAATLMMFDYAINHYLITRQDRLCGLVVRVPGYRSRGPGLIPGATRSSEK